MFICHSSPRDSPTSNSEVLAAFPFLIQMPTPVADVGTCGYVEIREGKQHQEKRAARSFSVFCAGAMYLLWLSKQARGNFGKHHREAEAR